MSSLSAQILAIIHNDEIQLTKRDVLECTECILQEYLSQQIQTTEIASDEEEVSVQLDDDGDYVDKNGYIYDVKKRIRIGQKNSTTKEKTLYTIV